MTAQPMRVSASPQVPLPNFSSPTINAADLVADGICSGACLVAPPSGRKTCTCACRGRYHGALSDTTIGDDRQVPCGERWWERTGWPGKLTNPLSVLIRSKTVDAFNKEYRAQNAREGFFLATLERSPRDFQVQWDVPAHNPALWPQERAITAHRQFCLTLLRQRRVRGATIAEAARHSEWGNLQGFSRVAEARTAEVLIRDAVRGDSRGLVRALYVLAGDPDPACLGYKINSLPLPAMPDFKSSKEIHA